MAFVKVGFFVILFCAFVDFFRYDTPLATLIILILVAIPLLLLWRTHSKKRALRESLIAFGVQDHQQLSPVQYEQFCSFLLENAGWSVLLTKASGDQGADIVAHRKGRKMVVQCKHWKASIGTKAVQEAYAAMAFYQAHSACVIGSSAYTRGAIALADKTGVLLLHHNNVGVL
jgi:restriction system protein